MLGQSPVAFGLYPDSQAARASISIAQRAGTEVSAHTVAMTIADLSGLGMGLGCRLLSRMVGRRMIHFARFAAVIIRRGYHPPVLGGSNLASLASRFMSFNMGVTPCSTQRLFLSLRMLLVLISSRVLAVDSVADTTR